MWDKTKIDKFTHQWWSKVMKEQHLGFKIIHVCFVEVGDSMLGWSSVSEAV